MTSVEEQLLENSYPDLYHGLNLIRQEGHNRTSQEIKAEIDSIRSQIIQVNRENAINYKDQGGELPDANLNRQFCYKKFVKSKLLFQMAGVDTDLLTDAYNHENIFNAVQTFFNKSNIPIGVITRVTGFGSSVISPIKRADLITYSFRHIIKNAVYFDEVNRSNNLAILVRMFVETISQPCRQVAKDENYFHNHGTHNTNNISDVHQALGMNDIDPPEYYI
jgi:hypothetical protein